MTIRCPPPDLTPVAADDCELVTMATMVVVGPGRPARDSRLWRGASARAASRFAVEGRRGPDAGASRPGPREAGRAGRSVQVAVPDGWHAGVELAGVAKELVRPLLVACGVRGSGVQDQPPGGDLLPVLLPKPGT